MKEVSHQEQFPEEVAGGQGEATGPNVTEGELVIISLLMRLYDLNMALLNHFDSDAADNIYESHQQGLTFNAQLFIPEIS